MFAGSYSVCFPPLSLLCDYNDYRNMAASAFSWLLLPSDSIMDVNEVSTKPPPKILKKTSTSDRGATSDEEDSEVYEEGPWTQECGMMSPEDANQA
ncbi:hypothetical protein AB6A40_001240 [Gnathostoma spinigerum]|uniref:Uncharacterized protein n=1 Tax=Gnathostoma spinigerum TaxID=75299 RepID=A0ABD6EAT5_9BILA